MPRPSSLPTRGDIVKAAKTYLGTTHIHQGRKPGVGLDCIGVIVCAGRAVGLRIEDCTTYGPRANPRLLMDYVHRNFDEIPLEDADHGDVVLFYWRRSRRHGPLPQHAGLLIRSNKSESGYDILHAHQGVRKVVRVHYTGEWPARALSAWRYKGVL